MDSEQVMKNDDKPVLEVLVADNEELENKDMLLIGSVDITLRYIGMSGAPNSRYESRCDPKLSRQQVEELKKAQDYIDPKLSRKKQEALMNSRFNVDYIYFPDAVNQVLKEKENRPIYDMIGTATTIFAVPHPEIQKKHSGQEKYVSNAEIVTVDLYVLKAEARV